MPEPSPAEPRTGPMAVADLTRLHIGWEIQVDDPSMTNASRSIWLIGLAARDLPGGPVIELRDELERPGRATLFRYAPNTPCRVSRPFPRPRRRRSRTAT